MATPRIATQPRVKNSKKSANSPHEVPHDPMLAQARAVSDTLRQLNSGHIPKGGIKLPLFNKDGTDFASPPPPVYPDEGRAHPAPKAGARRRSTGSSLPDLERHSRKCVVCNHPEREAIEEAFLHWHNPDYVANEFHFDDGRYLRRHAHAVGLYVRRRENYLFTLENLLERGDEIELTAAAYIKAVRAYACMCDTVRWSEPAIRVIGIRDHSRDQAPDAAQASLKPDSGLCSGRSAEGGPGTPLFDEESPREPVEETVPSSSLPQAAFSQPATAAQSPSSDHQAGPCSSRSAACSPGRESGPGTPLFDEESPRESVEEMVPSSSLPQASFDKPAPASSEPSPCANNQAITEEQSVAASSTSLAPARRGGEAASEVSAPFASRSLLRDAPSALLHNTQEPKDAEPRPHSSLATNHSPLPSNRPSPRLETGLSDTKQRKEAHSNRPQNAK
jgi:hypothetical protein